jgi:hypothetical protein
MSEFEASPDIMGRLEAALGLGEAAAPVSEVANDSPPEAGETPTVSDGLADFEWEGARLRVPESLTKAVMLQKDYTQKTQELSESRKTLEQLQAVSQTQQAEMAFNQSVAAEHQELGLIDQYLKQMSGFDWSKLPSEKILLQKIEIDQIRDRRAAIVDSINGKRNQFQQNLQAKIQELRGKSKERLSKAIDNFTEETEQTIRNHAKSVGLTERQVDSLLLDPIASQVFWESAQYRAVKAKAKDGKQAAPGEGVLRPGVAGERMPEAVKQTLAFGKQMKSAKTSQQKANLIEAKLAGGLFKGHK